MRITALGTGMPFCRREQRSSGWLVELGNGDVFVFDLGTGSSANLNALG
ncbi:MAG TPA: MBL fold metallo-hydrolase, partial [Candidatus Latescibacteria bacterium]|nr:MBL fold metallo-hydrolase [Candidatus Latescibacterota bacterium]